ncbi:AAA family ATPase [Streptomyces antimycoticus]
MQPLPLPAGTMCALVGPPGCGKSTFALRYPASWRICLDLFRLAATDSEADQTATPVAAEIQNLLLDARLARNLRTILDSTNVVEHVRAGLLARARYWQRPTAAVLFDVPLATVENQNASRDRVVPLHVVRELHELTPTREQLLAEGFGTVHLASELATAGAGR